MITGVERHPARQLIVLDSYHVQIPNTGSTSEVTLRTVTVPGGLMGLNGILLIRSIWSANNNANGKTIRVRFGGAAGTQYSNVSSIASNATYVEERSIANRGSLSSQIGGVSSGTGGWGQSTGAAVTSAVDTSVDTTLVFSAQLANAGDNLNLESCLVLLLRP